MGTEIQTVKNQMTLKNWAEEVAECQSSGMTVSAWKWISVRQHRIIINGMAICHAVFCCANIKYNLFNGSFCNIPIRHTSQLPKTYFFFLFLSIDAFSASRFLLIYNVIFKATSTNMQFAPFWLLFVPFLLTFKNRYVSLKCKNLCETQAHKVM